MKATTSIFQAIDLNPSALDDGNIIIRPPKHLKIFRATFFVSSNDPGIWNFVYINTSPITQINYQGIYLANSINSSSENNVAPTENKTVSVVNKFEFVLDRRGVGYMVDDFYVYGQGSLSIIWEGEIE